jgi:hypothetical protein
MDDRPTRPRSCIEAILDDDFSQTNRRTSHTRPAHIDRLIPSARTQGQGDEYLRPRTLPIPMFMCSRRSLARSVAPKVCPASRYRCLNPSMAIPCRLNLPSHTHTYLIQNLTIGYTEPNHWVRRMFQSWAILDQIETPNPGAQIFNRSMSCGRWAASVENIDVFRSICGCLRAFELVLTVTMRAIAQISFNRAVYKLPRTGGSKKR